MTHARKREKEREDEWGIKKSDIQKGRSIKFGDGRNQ